MFSFSGSVLQMDEEIFLISSERGQNSCFLYRQDFFSRKPVSCPVQGEFVHRGELLKRIDGLSSKQLPILSWQQPFREKFKDYFDRSQKLFEKKELQKVVPVVFERAKHSLTKPEWAFMMKSLLKNKTPYIYSAWDENGGVIGKTPEILFKVEKNILKTMALAGTRPLADVERISLLEDAKELFEHNWVVESLVEKLEELGKVSVGETGVTRHGILEHLKTPIEVKLENKPSYEEICRVLHPTPALGGVPQEKALSLLKKWDVGVERGVFGAPIGFQTEDLSLCLVAIRSLQWSKEDIRIGSGCGLVEKSQSDREWDELSSKRKSVKKALGIEE